MNTIKKLCLGIPNTGTIRAETVQDLIGTIFHTAITFGCGVHTILPYGCMIDENRNKCAQEALDIGASHLMFVDSDMAYPDDGIAVLASRDKQIIGANYNLRYLPLRSTVKMSNEKGVLLDVPGDQLPKIPFKCYAVATGFMLIQTEVFRRIEKPWFFQEWDPIRQSIIGEDVYFCKKARGKDIGVWCDPTIEVKHIGDYKY